MENGNVQLSRMIRELRPQTEKLLLFPPLHPVSGIRKELLNERSTVTREERVGSD